MRLFLTGRQSVARAIAQALSPGGHGHERRDDHFRIEHSGGEADLVSWCGGHLLQMAPPEHYDPRYHKWRLEDLPIFPAHWESLEVGSGAGTLRGGKAGQVRQLGYLRQALREVDVVVHAGDPDREGQWLVDEVLAYLEWQGPVQRLLLPDLHGQALRRSLREFEKQPPDNCSFEALSIAACTRSRADWLYGLNLTRACTLLGRRAGYDEVLSVGRVQTPLLGLVVKRDESIEGFVPQTYYTLAGKFRQGDRYCFAEYVDPSGMVLHLTGVEQARSLALALTGQVARLKMQEKQHHLSAPPLPLDLSALQIECSDRFGYSALEVLRIARRLYEEHHLITYPVSECRYLPEFLYADAEAVIDSVATQADPHRDDLAQVAKGADAWRKSSAWDSRRVSLHHGIVPVARQIAHAELSEEEYRVYSLIARFYLAQFYGDRETEEHRIAIQLGSENFANAHCTILHEGWQRVLPSLEPAEKSMVLPEWTSDTELLCEDVEVKERRTRPPLRYTESRLMEMMTHIPLARGSAALGTQSSRAQMMDTLFRRGYLMRGNKSIFSTSIGRSLIHALPESASSAEEMAVWESKLSDIEQLPAPEARIAADRFLEELQRHISTVIREATQKKNIVITTADELLGMEQSKHHCPRCHSLLRLLKSRYGEFWGCMAYPACQFTVPDRVDVKGNHAPDYPEDFHPRPVAAESPGSCPKCGSPLKKRRGKHGSFFGCSAYPACTYTTRHTPVS